MHIYIHIYIYIYIHGLGVSPTGKSYSFCSCVRASGRGEARRVCAGVRRGASCSWAAGAPIVLHRVCRRVASCLAGRVPCPSPLLLECDTNDLTESRSKEMDERLTMPCMRLSTSAQSNRGSVVRVAMQFATPARAIPGVGSHAARRLVSVATPAGASGHAHRCQVATLARQPVSVATPAGVS